MGSTSAMDHLEALTKIVVNNLENQHDWTAVKVHANPGHLPRQMISGLPPQRLYMHPDEQIEIIKAEKEQNQQIPQPPEVEWVLPTHLAEQWTIGRLASVFDAIEALPPGHDSPHVKSSVGLDDARWKEWRGPKRGKRLVLATVQDDSTIVYYLIHDGIVKPRQN
jgi:tRNA-splicing endonuclease subunit Sen15, fungi type